MHRALSLGSLAVALAATLGSSVATPTASRAGAHAYTAAVTSPTIRLTQADVDASNAKVRMAYGALARMWTSDFHRIGQEFVVPDIARYRSAFYSPCGVIGTNNAQYCPTDNTIFYDDIFVAGLAKQTSAALGTDGDMAALGVIAHEMGHAVALQLGFDSPRSYDNEAVADCLAGAFAQQSKKDGSLEPGDEQEAFYGMSMGGDPTPQPTGNERVDRRIRARLAAMGHGTKEQRMDNFKSGLEGGPGACLPDFR